MTLAAIRTISVRYGGMVYMPRGNIPAAVTGQMINRPYALALRRLKSAGLRPTRQRVALAKLLLETAPRHVTAEELFQEARAAGIPVSLATVYNTLHQFTGAGIMSEVVVGSGQSYFDTNPGSHYHYFDKTTGEIIDVPEEHVRFLRLPPPPPGKVIDRIDVVVRIRNADRPVPAQRALPAED